MASRTATVQGMYDNFGKGNIPGILEMFADDIRFVHSGGPALPYAKDRHGKTEAAAFFGELAACIDVTGLDVTRFVEQGDSVVAFGSWSGKAKNTGKAFASDWAMLWSFNSAGKVNFYQSFENTHAVAQALGA